MNIYEQIGRAIEEGLFWGFLNKILYKELLREVTPSYIRNPSIIYKQMDFGSFYIDIGLEKFYTGEAAHEGLKFHPFNWYISLNKPKENFCIKLSSEMFTTQYECNTFLLNGREERNVSEEEAFRTLIPRIVKMLRKEELVEALESLSKRNPELEVIQGAVKEWRLYCAYTEI